MKYIASSQIEKCKKCDIEMDNYHLFKYTWKNPIKLTYEHVLNGTILEQKNAIQYIKESGINEDF